MVLDSYTVARIREAKARRRQRFFVSLVIAPTMTYRINFVIGFLVVISGACLAPTTFQSR